MNREPRHFAALGDSRFYWRDELADPPVLQLPTDFPRRFAPSKEAESQDFLLPAELVAPLRDLARGEQTTLFPVLLAGYTVLLHRYTGDNDIVIGCPVADRSDNTLPLRTHLSADEAFRQLLRRVNETVIRGLQHQEVPLQHIVQDVLTDRDRGGSPLFQAMFIHKCLPFQPGARPGCELLDSDCVAAKVDLVLELMESAMEVHGRFVYRPGLWEAATMERMARHYRSILEQVGATPCATIDSYSLRTPDAQNLLPDPRATLEAPRQDSVADQIAAQALKGPDQLAIIQGTSAWTYQDVALAANHFAGVLQGHGVRPGDVVAVCGKPSFGLISSVIGTLTCRAVFLLLDPNLPRARQRLFLDQAGVHLLALVGEDLGDVEALAGNRSIVRVSAVTGEAVTCQRVNRSNAGARSPRCLPEDAAYIHFTSGTTGLPKGVVGSCQGLSHFVIWQREQFAVGPGDRIAQVTALSFDVVLREIFLPLISGAVLCLPEQDVDDPCGLWSWLDEQQITILHAVPSRLRMWLGEGPTGVSLKALRWLFVAGEPLSDKLVNEWRALFPGEIVNLYGPTETTLAKSWYHVPPSENLRPGVQPIGRPLPQTQLLLLGKKDRLCGIGELGEIVIRTPFRSLGYLHAEQTLGRFIANPFRDDPADVVYRTGDLGRYRPDGTVAIVGRLDDQIKVRGVRVEPGEIASHLCAHEQVHGCHVGTISSEQGEPQLVAWVIPSKGCAPTAIELRRHLTAYLPSWLIPSRFVLLDSFPLTPSGKVNRHALPASDNSRRELESTYAAPRNRLEEQLTQIWCDALGVEEVGIHDNFFVLGGHSLLAAHVNARMKKALEVDLPLSRHFEAPTIAELAREIEQSRERGLLIPVTALSRLDGNQRDRLLLSFAQQRLWFLDQMAGKLAAYNVSFAWRVRGPLNLEALRRSLETVVRRHEPLRTTFAPVNGETVQVIRELERLELPVEDLGALLADEQAERVARHCIEEAARPFDLSGDLMLRASLLRLGEGDHLLLLTMHHIATDAWSVTILWRELTLSYRAFCHAVEPDLPALPVRYADFAAWQRAELQGRQLERLVQYWRVQLEGICALELPRARPRPPVPSYRGARHDLELPDALIDHLKLLSRQEGVTLHMTLLAAFLTLLARYSGQTDIAVGLPIAGRTHPHLDGLIGFFVNILVLRTDLSGDPTFRELLGRVRKVSLDAYDHQDLPFEKLLEVLRPERHLGRNPLVQVLFQLLSFPDDDPALDGLELSRLPSSSRRTRFDLEIHLWQQPESVRGTVIYSTDLFEAATIERMVEHFVRLLGEIAADAGQRLNDLPLMTEAERHQLLVEWNDTAATPRERRCVHELFEQQADRNPEAIAVVFGNQQLTYRQLNERANQLAHYLRGLGVGAETLVGLCLERSPELLVGILGILKAGGAYVPLDADYPSHRLAFMVQDAAVVVLVSRRHLLDRLPIDGRQVVCLDTDAAWLRDSAHSNPSPCVTAENLAYVMFTSGSTGQPKGVAIRHTSIARLVLGNDYATFGPDRVFLQLAPAAFDASTFEIWGALLHGAKLVVAPAGLPDFRQLQEWIQRHGVTTLWLTATLFNQLVDQRPETLGAVAEILTGGEALSVRHISTARAALGQRVRLINGYGPTECTTFATCYRIPPGVSSGLERIPIGRPIARTQVFVLDDRRRLVPIGMPGELYIGGEGLARDYLNRPELTAEKFVPNPFSEDPGSRLYRTGDRCRWCPDGNLEFLGRLDEQVKLRGFRIEPGEIEAALQEHPGIAQSIVLLREDHPGDKRLVAYCIPRGDAAWNVGSLTGHLRGKLPEYMVPSAFVRVGRLPLTPGGKIDRRALPAPDATSPACESAYVAPRNPIEERLAAVWRQLLGVERVGIHDNFFQMGGHSLMVVTLIILIEKMFGRKLPIAALFQQGTICHLARLLFEQGHETELASAVELRPGDEGRPLYLMPSIQGELLFSKKLLDELGNRFRVVGIPFALHARNLEHFKSFRDTARSLFQALRAYQARGPYALAGFSYGGFLAYEIACLLSEIGETVDVLAVIDTGPERSGLRSWPGELLIRPVRILANLPRWMREELRDFSRARLVSGLRRKLNYLRRIPLTRGRSRVELDDVFDVHALPAGDLALMRTIYRAFCDYTPGRYPGKLTLFRAQTRPLFSGSSHDLGWSRFVQDLDIRQIEGNHETILRPPHLRVLAQQLSEVLSFAGLGQGRAK